MSIMTVPGPTTTGPTTTGPTTTGPTTTGPTTAQRSHTPVAERLLAAADEPAGDWRELPWDAAPVEGAPWMPWHQISLYGTPTWERLDPAARLTLSRHESASIASAGIWAENVLMQMLLRVAAAEPPRASVSRYALTEVGDECRHSLMFTRLLDVLDTPVYGPRPASRRLTAAFVATAVPVEVFSCALIVEELLDALQRVAMRDETIQPLARAVNRVHVVEEARHVSFARDELGRRWPRLSAPVRAALSMGIASSAVVTVGSLIDRRVYASVGLDPRAAAREARRSVHRRELLRGATARLTADFTELGVITPASRPVWRAAGLL